MAVTAAQLTGSFTGYLNRREAGPIFQRAARVSAIMRLAREVPLGWRGESYPVFGKITASWVAEAGKKDAKNLPVAFKNMDPKKIAVIVPVSKELVRANPGGFLSQVRKEIGDAFGRAFDLAAMYDQGGDGTAGGGPYASWLAQTTKSVELGTATQANGGIRRDLISALTLLVNDGKRLNGFAVDDRLEPTLLAAVDTTGRPIWEDKDDPLVPAGDVNGAARFGTLIKRRAFMYEGIYSGTTDDILGFGGDWNEAAWGVVNGISYSVSTEAAVTINGALVSLWENNLVAILAEAEYGWLVNDPEAFVELVDAV